MIKVLHRYIHIKMGQIKAVISEVTESEILKAGKEIR